MRKPLSSKSKQSSKNGSTATASLSKVSLIAVSGKLTASPNN
nr:MAG TPA: hypothetical protein [Caudoviricetes sp.]